jgi:NAD(P)-dependent dehydrogenase (short-subunit alcohol dehydrogenase family)
MAKLAGKTALVTGGTTGIGYATAELFLAEGARVAITGQDSGRVAAAAASLGRDVVAIRADAADLADIERATRTVADAFGKLDVLFVNAGVAKFMPAEASDEALYDAIFDVNVKGAFFTIQKALPILNDGASVIVNTSINASMGMAGTAFYGASKAAMRNIVRTLARELAGRGIRVNAVAPGPIETPIFGKTGMSAADMEAIGKSLVSHIPLGRFGQASEIAGPVLFLAGPDSSFVTGEEIVVDGGWIGTGG